MLKQKGNFNDFGGIRESNRASKKKSGWLLLSVKNGLKIRIRLPRAYYGKNRSPSKFFKKVQNAQKRRQKLKVTERSKDSWVNRWVLRHDKASWIVFVRDPGISGGGETIGLRKSCHKEINDREGFLQLV